MSYQAYVERMIDMVDPAANVILNMSYEEAAERVAAATRPGRGPAHKPFRGEANQIENGY